MLPRRLGVRFALEALFLVLLALGAGLAGLRPMLIVVVMASAWLLVALAELTAERIERSPLSYLLPGPAPVESEEPEPIFGPRPEERTVVAPPEPVVEPEADTEHPPTPDPTPEPAPEPEPVPDPEPIPEPGPEPAAEEASLEPSLRVRLRSRLRRRRPELQPAAPSPPRHVKLLPRRAAPEPSRADREVAELFGRGAGDEEKRPKPEETGS